MKSHGYYSISDKAEKPLKAPVVIIPIIPTF
jgi:hypothetical protein